VLSQSPVSSWKRTGWGVAWQQECVAKRILSQFCCLLFVLTVSMLKGRPPDASRQATLDDKRTGAPLSKSILKTMKLRLLHIIAAHVIGAMSPKCTTTRGRHTIVLGFKTALSLGLKSKGCLAFVNASHCFCPIVLHAWWDGRTHGQAFHV
jgi:hypothetical protein